MTQNTQNMLMNQTVESVSVSAPPDVVAGADESETVVLTEFSDGTSASVGRSEMNQLLDYITPGEETLSAFLSRPVKIFTQQWDSTAFTAAEFNPWALFLANPVIKNKITNFSMFRATLHVRAMFDGTPLQAGSLQLSYMPTGTVAAGTKWNRPAAGWDVFRGSQLRNVEIYATGSSSGEIVCPFIFRKPFASIIAGASDIASLGTCRLQQLIPMDSSASGVVVAGTIQILAWMTDVDLRVATYVSAMNREPVAKKEVRPNFNISRPATIVAKAASMLSGLPYVGPAATMASMVATGVASIAAAFGYARPFDLRDKVAMLPRYAGAFALVDGVDSPEKLSCDPKQGVPVGPEWLNLPGEQDQMSIASIASRESLVALYSSLWTTATPPGTQILGLIVHPFGGLNGTPATDRRLSPVAYAAAPFKYWTGSIRWRIKAICPGMTRGRLLIFHYPHNDLGYQTMSYSDALNTCQNCILDLESSTDVEFVVRPSMTRPWLYVGNMNSSDYQPSEDFVRANGRIVVVVMNALSAPLASKCGLQFYVRGGEDFQVAVPQLSSVAAWTWKNAMMPSSTRANASEVPPTGPGGANAPNAECELTKRSVREVPAAPYFGERVESLRSMVKRFTHYAYWRPTMDPTDLNTTQIALTITDDFYGNQPMSTAGSYSWTWLTYATMPFMAVRGGVRYRAVLGEVPGAAASLKDAATGWERGDYAANAPSGRYATSVVGTSQAGNIRAALLGSGNGLSYTPQNRQPVAEAEFPYYSNDLYSFAGSSASPTPHPDGVKFWAVAGIGASAEITPFDVEVFQAAADDFSCNEWMGCGTVDITGTAPFLLYAFANV